MRGICYKCSDVTITSGKISLVKVPHHKQGWGQNTLYSHTRVLEYILSCSHDVLVLVVLMSKCTRTCTGVHSKIGCTHEYILSTIQVLFLRIFPVIKDKSVFSTSLHTLTLLAFALFIS